MSSTQIQPVSRRKTPAPRLRGGRQAEHGSEGAVVKSVLQWLSLDPRVAEVRKQNGGAFTAEHNGKTRYVQFVRDVHGKPVTVLDIAGYLVDGRGFEIECKVKLPRPVTVQKWKGMLPSTLTRDANIYLQQDARIQFLRKLGAVAGFATCANDAKLIIDWAFRRA